MSGYAHYYERNFAAKEIFVGIVIFRILLQNYRNPFRDLGSNEPDFLITFSIVSIFSGTTIVLSS